MSEPTTTYEPAPEADVTHIRDECGDIIACVLDAEDPAVTVLQPPWEADDYDTEGRAMVWGPDGDAVAHVWDNPALGETAHERAAVVARVPELYAAAKEALDWELKKATSLPSLKLGDPDVRDFLDRPFRALYDLFYSDV